MVYASSVYRELNIFYLRFYYFFNVLLRPIYFLVNILVLQSCQSVWDLNLMLFPSIHLTQILETEAVHISLQCCSFTCRQSLPNFSSHQILIGITVSSPAKSYIEYTWMTSLIYQYVIVFCSFMPPLSHLIICIFAKTNSSLVTSLATVTFKWPWNVEGSHFPTAESLVPFPLFTSLKKT